MLTLDHNPRLEMVGRGRAYSQLPRWVLAHGEAEALLLRRSAAILTAIARASVGTAGYATDRVLKRLAIGAPRHELRKHPDYNCGLQKHVHFLRVAFASLGEPDAIQRVSGADPRFPGGYRLAVPLQIIPEKYSVS